MFVYNIFVYNSFSKYFFKVLQNQFALMGFEQIASSKFKQRVCYLYNYCALAAIIINIKYQYPIYILHIRAPKCSLGAL